MQSLQHPERFMRHFISSPIIYSVFLPVLITDLWVEIYHRTCFPLYKIPYIKRNQYIKVVDRGKLDYLKWPQKINCMYCGYVNGAFRYWSKIASETEKYWCGIQHEETEKFSLPNHHIEFSKYGDAEEFKNKYCKLKRNK